MHFLFVMFLCLAIHFNFFQFYILSKNILLRQKGDLSYLCELIVINVENFFTVFAHEFNILFFLIDQTVVILLYYLFLKFLNYLNMVAFMQFPHDL